MKLIALAPCIFTLLAFAHNTLGQQAELIFPSGHTDDVNTLDVDSSGTFLLSSSDDGTIKTWDIASGFEFKTYQGHEAKVYAACFGHNNHAFFVSGGQDNQIIVWDTYTGAVKRKLLGHEAPITTLAVSQDNKFILSGSNDKTARIWNRETGKCLKVFRGHQQVVNTVAFSKNQQEVITGSGLPFLAPTDNTIRIWDIKTGKNIRIISGHGDVVNSLDISEDGKYIISASDDETIRLWNMDTGKEEKKFPENTLVTSARMSRDGKFILVSLVTGAVHLWNVGSEKIERTYFKKAHPASVSDVAFVDKTSYFMAAQDAGIKMWDMNTGNLMKEFKGDIKPAYALAYSQTGSFIASSNLNEGITLWNMHTGHQIRTLASDFLGANRLVISPDEQWLFATYINVAGNSPILRYDLNNRDSVGTFQGHPGIVNDLAFSPDNKKIASCSNDEICVWDTRTTGRLLALQGHQQGIMTVGYSPSGDTLFSGATDGSLMLWDTTGKLLHSLKGAKYRLMIARFSPNGKFLLSGGGLIQSSELILWDIKTGQIAQRFPSPHPGFINSMDFSSDGRYAVSGSFDGSVCLWDIEKKALIGNIKAHDSFVTEVSFSPDNQYIISSSGDNTLKIWNFHTQQIVLTLFKLDKQAWGVTDATNNYTCSKELAQKMGFKIDHKIYRFEQFDLKFNRPDKIAAQMPQKDSFIVTVFEKAFHTRLRKMHFTESMLADDFHVPQITVQTKNILSTTTNDRISFTINVLDDKNLLDRLYVFINDVPIYGINGIDLRTKNTHQHEQTLDLALVPGENKIQVSVLSQTGAESLKETIYVTCKAPTLKPNLYIVGIGVGQFSNRSMNLTYPTKDVADLVHFFQQNNDTYGQVIVDTILDAALKPDRLKTLKQKLMKSQANDCVVFLAAGHGLYDKDLNYYLSTYHTDFDNPQLNAIPYQIFETLLDSIPARRKLMLIDACHAGEIDKETAQLTKAANTKTTPDRKFRHVGAGVSYPLTELQNAFELMQNLFVDLRRGNGASVIVSAKATEYAEEGGTWENSAFMDTLLSGLQGKKADGNGDGAVMVSELQTYLGTGVEKLTEGRQHSAFRMENVGNDWRVW